MEISNSTTTYKAPQIKVVETKVQSVLCSSLDGSFGLSNGGNVEKGSDKDWDE